MNFIDDRLVKYEAKDTPAIAVITDMLLLEIIAVHKYVKGLKNSNINVDSLIDFVNLPSHVHDMLNDRTDKRLYTYYVYEKFLPDIKKKGVTK